jgi:sec-independent protein translocase protein TatA
VRLRKDADVFGLGAPELLIILLVVLVLFGGTKLPGLARSLGRAQSEFKAGLSESDKKGDDAPTGKSKPANED